MSMNMSSKVATLSKEETSNRPVKSQPTLPAEPLFKYTAGFIK